ncbi:MAG TPA: archease [Longimicrobiales bacterium]|nr:archease [Longimicrobiales bacterium]
MAVEHTADVGVDVAAPTLPELYARAAAGMTALLYGGPPEVTEEEPRTVEVRAPHGAALLREWLRELLYLQEVEGFVFAGAELDTLTGERLSGRVRGGAVAAAPEREIKGVTLHGLVVERCGAGWHARVIFDV